MEGITSDLKSELDHHYNFNYPFPPRHHDWYWCDASMSYDEAIEAFHAQSKEQQHIRRNPVNRDTPKKVIAPDSHYGKRYPFPPRHSMAWQNTQYGVSYDEAVALYEHERAKAIDPRLVRNPLVSVSPKTPEGSRLAVQAMNRELADIEAVSTSVPISSNIPQLNAKQINSREVEQGIFLWIESKGTGHTFLSIHQPEKVTVFSYGRYDDVGLIPAVGEGVLLKLEADYAIEYILRLLYRMEAKVFKIYDVSPDKINKYFNALWGSSSERPDAKDATETTKLFGRVIDNYDLSGNNCVTHSVNALKASGSRIFDNELFSLKYSEDFVIPSSLERYMIDVSQSFEMMSIDVTSQMKSRFPNTGNLSSLENAGTFDESLGAFGESSGYAGSSSGYSGGTRGGVLGSSNEP
ncbi:hypothetical protein [Vibrio neptunius]|uniref:hypothetical protein n=1 Tax=Vibrio neptunius TaxID=170651 RepID=UPI000698842D|nr:hypothetical protein [Vibrio neptunius]